MNPKKEPVKNPEFLSHFLNEICRPVNNLPPGKQAVTR